MLDELGRWIVARHHRLDVYVGVALLPGDQFFGQPLFLVQECSNPVGSARRCGRSGARKISAG